MNTPKTASTGSPGSSSSPYRDAADLQSLLEQVFSAPYDHPEADLLTRSKLAVAFVFSDPDVRVLVDGRAGSGAVQITFGRPEQDAPLTFSMNGKTAHPFWMGELNVVTEMALGRIQLQGSLLTALKIAPMMPVLQEGYRRAWAARTP